MLFQLLSGTDKAMMKSWIDCYSGVEYVNSSKRTAELSQIMSYWAIEKKRLFKLLGGHMIVSKEVNFKKPIFLLEEEMDYMLYCESKASDFREEVNRKTYYSDIEELKEVHYEIMLLLQPSALASNVYNGCDFKVPTPDGKWIQVQKGCKPVKILGKIATAWNINGFEEFRLAHSLVLNQKAVKGELCLSIHPLDYMTMSDNECDWDSCMSWRNEGCYRRGTVEMMNSKYVVVAYLKAREDMNIWADGEPHPWSNKKWRELFIVDEDFITGIKGYPYQNTELEAEVINWLAELSEKNLGVEFSEGVHQYEHCSWFKIGNDSWKFSFHTDDMYNDFGTREHYVRVAKNPKDVLEHLYDMNYSGCHPCMSCGQLHGDYEDEGGLVCGDCCSYYYCDSCGERIYDEDEYWLDNNRLCYDCYHNAAEQCAITEEYHYENNMTRLYFAIEGAELFDEMKDPSILIFEEDLSSRDWETYFTQGIPAEWKTKEVNPWGWRYHTYHFVELEDLTEAGVELFGLDVGDIEHIRKDRAEEREAKRKREEERREMMRRAQEEEDEERRRRILELGQMTEQVLPSGLRFFINYS